VKIDGGDKFVISEGVPEETVPHRVGVWIRGVRAPKPGEDTLLKVLKKYNPKVDFSNWRILRGTKPQGEGHFVIMGMDKMWYDWVMGFEEDGSRRTLKFYTDLLVFREIGAKGPPAKGSKPPGPAGTATQGTEGASTIVEDPDTNSAV